MRYMIEDIPITNEFRRTNDTIHYWTEHAVRVNGPPAFPVYVRRVNVSSRAFLFDPPKVVRFSESQYAIPNSKNIRLRTTAYYRDWEESDGCGIGDAEEATLRRNSDFATFQREAGQIPISGAHHIQMTSTHRKECWVLCYDAPRLRQPRLLGWAECGRVFAGVTMPLLSSQIHRSSPGNWVSTSEKHYNRVT